MSKVNFVDEFNTFMRYAKNNQLTGRERLLWIALFEIANDRAIYNAQVREYDWPDGFIPIPNSELSLHSTLDKRGIEAMRNALKQRKLIDFHPGIRNKRPAEYRLFYLSLDVGHKIVPNDVPMNVPMNVPMSAPMNVPMDVPVSAPMSIPKTGVFGYKNAPINLNTDISQNQTRGKSGVNQTPGGGLVDLDGAQAQIDGLVKLPWEGVMKL